MTVADFEALMAKVEEKRAALDAIPMWRPIKRQDAAREYRYALYFAALAEYDAAMAEGRGL